MSYTGAVADNVPQDSVEWEITADITTMDGETYRVDVNGTAWQVASKNSAYTDSQFFKAYATEKFVIDHGKRVRRYPIDTADALHLELNSSAFIYLSAPVRGGQDRRSIPSKGEDIILSAATVKHVRFYQSPRTPLP